MPVESLLNMARRACIRYARRIEDIGDLPYDVVRPILLKIENPDQLYEIEQKSPQIIGHDAEIWLTMIKRDIPDWETKPHQPSNPQNWYKVYRKLRRDLQNEKAVNEARLKAALTSINTLKQENTARVVNDRRRLPVAKDPVKRNYDPAFSKKRMSAAYGNKSPFKPPPFKSSYNSPYRASKVTVQMTALERIRKESRDARNPRMSRPTHELAKRSTGPKQAPARFVEDLRRNKQQHATFSATSPKELAQTFSARLPSRVAPSPEYNLTADREARLRALKSGKKPEIAKDDARHDQHNQKELRLSTQFLEDDDLDDDDDFHNNDFPDEIPKMRMLPTGPSFQHNASTRKVHQLGLSTNTSRKRNFDEV